MQPEEQASRWRWEVNLWKAGFWEQSVGVEMQTFELCKQNTSVIHGLHAQNMNVHAEVPDKPVALSLLLLCQQKM